ncbi:hypothetical protein [Actinoplanes sp. NPDC026619]|uniref:hypothetical protein n=1 Tax=Actinoplanes sp. NPDC026619 TaxID=3155798 RepID=UPI0033CA4B05
MTDWLGPAQPFERSLLPPAGESVGHPGAKGVVHVVDESAYYKEYLEPIDDPGHLDELIAWRRSLPAGDRAVLDAHCAWPLRRVTDGGRTTGFLMAPAPADFWADMLGERHTVELQHLVHTAAARRLGLTVPDRTERLRLVQDLAELLALLDSHGMIYGDVSEKNVLWTLRGTPRIYLIDCDNARRAGSPNRNAAMARNDAWRDPLLGPDDMPDADSDRFALAVFFYRVFYGVTVSVDQGNGTALLPDDAPHLPTLERLLGAGLGSVRPRPAAAQWAAALRDADPAGVAAPAAAAPVRRRPTKMFASVAVGLVIAGAVAVPLVIQSIHAGPTPAPAPSASSAPAPTVAPSPSPALLDRKEALAAWAAGPVKIRVDHYLSYLDRAEKRSDDYTWVHLRTSVTNKTSDPLDLTSAEQNLVLVMDTEPKLVDGDATSFQMDGLVATQPLFGAGFSDGCAITSDDGTEHDITWTGKSVAAGSTFTSKHVNGNGITYWFPPISSKATDDVTVAPGKLHILGIGWRDAYGEMQGFTPVSAWKGPNSQKAFLSP